MHIEYQWSIQILWVNCERTANRFGAHIQQRSALWHIESLNARLVCDWLLTLAFNIDILCWRLFKTFYTLQICDHVCTQAHQLVSATLLYSDFFIIQSLQVWAMSLCLSKAYQKRTFSDLLSYKDCTRTCCWHYGVKVWQRQHDMSQMRFKIVETYLCMPIAGRYKK